MFAVAIILHSRFVCIGFLPASFDAAQHPSVLWCWPAFVISLGSADNTSSLCVCVCLQVGIGVLLQCVGFRKLPCGSPKKGEVSEGVDF